MSIAVAEMEACLQSGQRREAEARKAGVWSAAQRVISVATKWVTVPLAVGVLGPARYGAWLSIMSFIAWLAWSDLGVPAAFTNPFAGAVHTGARAKARTLLGSAVAFLTAASLVLAVVAVPLFLALDPATLFGPSVAPIRDEFRVTLAVVAVLALVSVPLRLVDALVLALQRVRWLAATETAAALVTLAGVVAWRYMGGGLPSLAAVTLLPSLLGRVVLWAILTRSDDGVALPALGSANWPDTMQLIRRGSLFTVAATAEMAVTQSPVFFLARLRGVALVPSFVIPFQVFVTAMQGIVALIWPMWGAYAEGSARREWEWIRSAHRRATLRIMAIAVVGFGALAVVTPFVIRVWVGPQFVPGNWLLLEYWILFSLWAWCHAWNTLVTGLDQLRLRTVAVVCAGITAIVVTPVTVSLFGLNGAPAGILVALLLTQVWMLPVFSRRPESTASC